MYYNSSYAHYDTSTGWSTNNRVPGYSTDQIAAHLTSYIRSAASSSSPFFAVAAPVAPHIAAGAKFPNGTKLPYPVPKKEYENLYQDLEVPKSLNFNPANRSGVNSVWELARLGEANLGYFGEFYRRRQRALKSVDDLVGTVVAALEESGVLENTYIIYSSDNVGDSLFKLCALLTGVRATILGTIASKVGRRSVLRRTSISP